MLCLEPSQVFRTDRLFSIVSFSLPGLQTIFAAIFLFFFFFPENAHLFLESSRIFFRFSLQSSAGLSVP